MGIIGLPNTATNPEFTRETFSIFIPKLKEWVHDTSNADKWNKFVDICNHKINIGFWGEDWEYAFSLAVAHYICITDPCYVESIGADTASGGVMGSRSVGGVNYSYDLSKTMNDNQAYKFWCRTGYGNELVTLSCNRGWVGILVCQ